MKEERNVILKRFWQLQNMWMLIYQITAQNSKEVALMIQLYFDFDNLIDKCHVTCNYKQSLKSFSLYFSDTEVF